MKSGVRLQLATALAVLAALLCTVPATATTFMMASDESLVERSAAVVEARVLSRDHAPGVEMPATDYMIEVERVLSGEISGRNLIVRVPGGVRDDGIGLFIDGMPELVVGERVLLFLSGREDGTYGIHNLMLGAFHEVARGGKSFYIRGLSGAVELVVDGMEDRSGYYRLRSAEPFRRWIESAGRGDVRQADYFVDREAGYGEDGDPGRVTGQFRLFQDTRNSDNPNGNNLNIRWFNFDSGQPVDWRIEPGGQPGFNANQTANAFQAGMAVWNDDPGSSVNYRHLGTTNSKKAFEGGLDMINSLVYRNVDGSIDSGDFTCTGNSAEGTLALGGPFYCRPGSNIQHPQSSGPYAGVACPAPAGADFNAAFEAEIVTNKNIECLFDLLRSQPNGAQLALRALEALFGHELGHTLGIAHSCTDGQVDEGNCPALQANALMFPFLHTDGRGAVLNNDDRNAIRTLYPGSSGPTVPAPPTDLSVVLFDSTSVRLDWQDNSNNESSFVVQMAVGESGGFANRTAVGANVEMVEITGLDNDTLYRFRVRARNSGGPSTPSNVVEITTDPAIPAAPSGLVANAASSTAAALAWEDNSDNETEFVIEARTPQSGAWAEVKAGVTTTQTTVEGLPTGVPHAFRVRAGNLQGTSDPSNVSAATPVASLDGCTEDAETLCLLDDRFQVTVDWRNQHSPTPQLGAGQADELTGRSGTFWFFRQDNIELIVKVLDGTNFNQFYWTFYGALTDVEYWITVVDTESADSKTYYNPPGGECGQFDNASIPSDLPTDSLPQQASVIALPASPPFIAEGVEGSCVPSATTLCLLDDRFAVEVDFVDQHHGNQPGVGTAVPEPASERTGYFWFFNAANIELVVKALDGTGPGGNGHFWFFYGSLSDVGYTITVTDTVTDRTKTYVNEPGGRCGQFDNAAFPPEGVE